MISIWLIKMLRCWMRKNTQKKTNVENWIFLSLDFSRFVSIAQDWQYGTRCKFVAATAHLAGRPYRARRMPVCVSVRCKPLPPLCDCECGWQAASDVVYERCFVVIAQRIEPIRVTGCCLCQFGCVGAGMRSIHTHTHSLLTRLCMSAAFIRIRIVNIHIFLLLFLSGVVADVCDNCLPVTIFTVMNGANWYWFGLRKRDFRPNEREKNRYIVNDRRLPLERRTHDTAVACWIVRMRSQHFFCTGKSSASKKCFYFNSLSLSLRAPAIRIRSLCCRLIASYRKQSKEKNTSSA